MSQVVQSIVDEIFLAPDVALIGKSIGYEKSFLEKLIYGAISHDIGVAKLSPKLFMKRGAWDKNEFTEYQKHTKIGYEELKKANEITELSKIIALSHHERLDGSGYPEHKKNEGIHEIVRIVSIADEFDNLVTGNGEYRSKKYTIINAMEKVMADSAGRLDATLTAYLTNRIALYPNGCMVKLSDGSYGLIKEQNQNMPYRPIVRIITDTNGKEAERKEVNLVTELALTITQSKMEDEAHRL